MFKSCTHTAFNFSAPDNIFCLFYRSPDPSTHGFILQYLSSEAYCYAVSSKPVIYILDLVKLDVPNLFIGPPLETGTQDDISVPAEKFKEHLHSYIASNDLQRELLKNVDVIMVSLFIFTDV